MKRQSCANVRFLKWFNAIFSQLFGNISWNKPPWLKKLGQCTRDLFQPNPWRGIGWLVGFMIVSMLCATGIYWYWHRYQPILITTQITPPSITPIDKRLIPEPLIIDFGLKTERGFTPSSVAPISQIGKAVNTGIHISPPILGQWQWEGDKRLIFTPKQDWPAGERYQIAFKQHLFAPQIAMAAYHCECSTLPLQIEVAELKLYQDLKDPLIKKIIGTLNFNFPVDGKSLTQRTHLVLQAIKNDRLDLAVEHYPLTITYDSHQRTAYIESAPVTLPGVPRFMNLVIDKGVNSLKGPSATTSVVTQKLLIPDVGSCLQIKNVYAGIERNQQDIPEQILTIETTVGMSNEELLKSLNAYVLPKDYPALPFQPLRKDFKWSQPGEVTADVLKLAKMLHIHAMPEDHPFPTMHRFKLQADASSHLYLHIAKGLTAFGGYHLSHDYASVLQTPEYPKEIHFLHRGSLMALNGEKKFCVAVRGIPEVKFSIGQVLEHHVNHLVTQTYGDWQHPTFQDSSFGKEMISQIISEFRPFNMANPGDLQYTTIDLDHYLANDKNALGLFLLKAQSWDAKNNIPTDIEKTRLILITDMNLIVKDNSDETHDLFIQSISQGIPIEGAEAAIMGRNGLPIVTRATDEQGHANFPSLKDFKEDRSPAYYLVRKENDTSFIPYQRNDRLLNYSRFNVDGVNIKSENALCAYLFSDRDLYRPGEAIDLGVIIKNRFAKDPISELPLEAVITDPRGAIVLDQKMTLHSNHFISLHYQLPTTAPTGQYNVNLYIVKESQHETLLGYKSVRVEEFLPDRLTMEADFQSSTLLENGSTLGWKSPDELKAKICLWNLFGLPATNCRVTAKIFLAPRALSFPQFSNYHFVDPLYDPHQPAKVFTENLTEANTDSQGQALFNLNLERFSKAIYQLTFFAEGFEADSGRAVTTETSALIIPLYYLVGFKPDGDLNYLKHHSQHHVNFIAINPELTLSSMTHLHMQMVEVKTVSTLLKKPDGTYHYQSVQQEIPISKHPFEIGVKSSDFKLATDRIGDFALVLSDDTGNLLSKISYSVVGESRHPIPKNAELNVKLDKNDYLPGETIEMEIKAPYTGAGLMTIERDRVYTYKWFKTDSPTSLQTLTIPSDYQGNGYVNVTFVRDWNSDEIFINPLSYAAIPFNVSHAQQTLDVDVKVPMLIHAGEALPIQFSTSKAANILIFAVDEGILQVANYDTPDPLAYFFSKQALTVNTWQIADLILPKYSNSHTTLATGGDGTLKLLAMNLNPFKRKSDKAVAFWSGMMTSDTTPTSISFKVPDSFNGRLRVMAVAVAPDAVGSTVAQTEVQAHFVIHPHVPTFIVPGDTVIVTAGITKTSKEDDNKQSTVVNIIASPQLDIIGSSEESVVIPPGQERIVTFKLKANGTVGEAQLMLTATQGEITSKREVTLSIRPASAYQTHLISGYEHSSKKTINHTKPLYPEHRLLQATASTHAFILCNGLHTFLTHFPLECTEQLICKSFATLAMAKQPIFQLDPEEVQKEYSQTIQMLRERQTDKGGFCYWPGNATHSDTKWVTIFAMDYLTEAKLNGYSVPADVFKAGIHYLDNFAKQETRTLKEARMQAYAIYLLTRNGIVTTHNLTNLQLNLTANHKHWQKDITGVYMAATYQLLQSTEQADRLIENYQLQQASQQLNGDFYTGLISDAQYVTVLAGHFPKRLQKIGGQALMALVQGIAGDQLNTLSAAYSIQALSAQAQIGSPAKDHSLRISEILSDHSERNLISLDDSCQKVNFDAEAKQLCFYNPSNQTYFYQIYQAGFDKNSPKQPIRNGLEIFRDYQNKEGKSIESIELGNTIDVHIQSRTLNNQTIDHVAIVDLLPGGFEVVPHSIEASGCDYIDVREDRLIFYRTLHPSAAELKYRLRAVNKGEYAVPPIFAQAIYHQQFQAQGMAGRIVVR